MVHHFKKYVLIVAILTFCTLLITAADSSNTINPLNTDDINQDDSLLSSRMSHPSTLQQQHSSFLDINTSKFIYTQPPVDKKSPILQNLQSLPPITVSGLSSGAFFAVQLGTAFSRLISSVGVIAGGVYNAAQNNVITAMTVMEHPEYISLPLIYSQLMSYETLSYVDPTHYLSQQNNYIFSGTQDTTVNPLNGDKLNEFYHYYSASVEYQNKIPSEHAFLTTKPTPHQCDYKGSPFINNCNFDLLTSMYKRFFPQQSLLPPTVPLLPNLHVLDQYLFVPPQYKIFGLTNGLQRRSYIYVPENCEEYILNNELFNMLKYDQQRVDDSTLPGPKQREFEQLRDKLWYQSAMYAYMNSTNAYDYQGHLFNNVDDINGNINNNNNNTNTPKEQPQCRIHIALHGCKQTLDHIGIDYLQTTGYLEIAEANNIITIFPQAAITALNPNGCYDWWGYSTPLYATRFGVQTLTVMNSAVTIASILGDKINDKN